ncbi:MAG: T9SS type A sorting domain-containing protein [Saprospiraceae bacterium]|nr:T9SS type A sorting domain-containing protein [Saprospiraceae bacterium]
MKRQNFFLRGWGFRVAAVVLTILFVHLARGYAQQIPTNPTITISYDLKTLSYVSLVSAADTQFLTKLDRLQFRRAYEEEHVETFIDENDDLATVVTYLNPRENLSDWFRPIHKMVFDKTGVRLLDSLGNTIHAEQFYDVEVFQNNLRLVGGLLGASQPSSFGQTTSMSPSAISEFEALGFEVEEISTGKIKVQKNDMEIIFDFPGRVIERNTYREGDLQNKMTTIFGETTTGEAVPRLVIQRTYQTLYGGACVERVTTQRYDNYNIQRNTGGGERSASFGNPQGNEPAIDEMIVKIYPNPTNDFLKVELATNREHLPAQARLVDTFGRVRKTAELATGLVEIEISSLQPGVYFLETERGGIVKRIKFVKL